MEIFPKEPVFTEEELLRFANIFDNAGQVFLAGLVIAPFFSNLDINRLFILTLGVLAASSSWLASWRLTKEASKL
ncbi:MAG: hypothetical protein CEO21_282 [Microgenomates group bacterium Gr01-1014_80]|nr:MAG: hypothetical protein CEO21_282 [Microgenomates group bacterium Gr01-1014_80]